MKIDLNTLYLLYLDSVLRVYERAHTEHPEEAHISIVVHMDETPNDSGKYSVHVQSMPYAKLVQITAKLSEQHIFNTLTSGTPDGFYLLMLAGRDVVVRVVHPEKARSEIPLCETCSKPAQDFKGGPLYTPEEQKEVDGYHASFRAPDGSPTYHTGHLRPDLMRLPMRWFCKEHHPKEN